MVSVILITYNHGPFISETLDSILRQEVDFPYEIVIGEDCSPDNTLEICEAYARRYPDRIRLLPSDRNWGMVNNYFRTITECRGKYVAFIDGDDYWTDPLKLARQVDFLERNPEYGLVYTDIETISMDGQVIRDEALERRRKLYRQGEVFFDLFKENFINTCTVMVAHDLFVPAKAKWNKYWFTYDYWLWMLVAMRAKVGYLPLKTAHYRKHPGGVTNSTVVTRNKKRTYYLFHHIVTLFDKRYGKPISETEKMILFRKMLSLLYRRQGTWEMKRQILAILPKYNPGVYNTFRIFVGKMKRRLPAFLPRTIASQP